MLDKKALETLKSGKSLLAFSHGVDSTALFYLLLKENIEFDLAFVNYNTRASSKDEEESAKSLASKFNKNIYIKNLNFDLNLSNFESLARSERYKFFDEICAKFNYKFLITAHQLNDMMEWFLMRLSKGSGLVNSIGMNAVDEKENYTIVRPLLFTSRDKIQSFLDENTLKYFIDSSNLDTKFERNYIRANFSDKLISEFESGIKQSFKFLLKDRDILLSGEIINKNELYIIEKNENFLNLVDKVFKKFGVVMSQKQRVEAKKDSVISGKVAISYRDNKIYIAPYKTPVMDKKFKEACRIQKVPRLLRGYIFLNQHLLKHF
ncbi:MAG: tRNA lysidine(34) synthetase TilS [Campylobacteraceae bacterium]|nr:tRNA lysidine(34) synthetase TilS [Campylobacteraceae bacterium]